MNKSEFKEAINELQDFEKDRQKLQAVLDAICPTSTGVVEIGGCFIESYINILEIALNSPAGWVSAFVYECCFGDYPMTGSIDGKDFSITTADELYDLIAPVIPDVVQKGIQKGLEYPM